MPEQVWRPLSCLWYDIVIPARDAFDDALFGEKQSRNRLRKRRCSADDYRNATMITARALGQYQEAIRMADLQILPLAELLWGESKEEEPLLVYGIVCGSEGFMTFTEGAHGVSSRGAEGPARRARACGHRRVVRAVCVGGGGVKRVSLTFDKPAP